MNAARDLFDEIPRVGTPAAELQELDRHLKGRAPDREVRGRLSPSGCLGVCGTCGESSPWIIGEHDTGMVNCRIAGPQHHFSSTSACAFPTSQWKPVDAQTLARRDAQRGIDQAADAAERACNGWSERAFVFVKRFAEERRGRGPYIGHDIVQASLLTDLPQPLNSKAWGQPIQRAARARIIKRTERGYAPDPNRHANPVPEWETA